MPGGKSKSRPPRKPKRQEDHPCIEWFRWFVGHCLRVDGGESTREVLSEMRAILDAALESIPQKRSRTRTSRRRPRGT